MGAMAEMLAAFMNPNVGIGEHAAMYVDYQVVEWCKQMMNYPSTASGILLSGGSMANITALAVARNHQSGKDIRKDGLTKPGLYLTLYCSSETHSCIQKAAEVLGLGTDSVRKIPVDHNYRIDTIALVKTIEEDIVNGFTPFCIIGNAGTVNTAAIDPLQELLEIRDRFKLWLHIDGAFGALAKLVPEYEASLKAIEQADSVAFDLHKWMYMPYEVGCTLIRNSDAHRNTFAITPNYLLKHERGLAAGPEPMNNFGLELSRGFKALKVWMSIKEHGLEKYTDMIRQNIAQAYYLGELIGREDKLELLAPVSMNIVCYRYWKEGITREALNNLNKEIVMQLQEEGIASPSSTLLNDNYAIRVAITNQRSRKSDFELLVKETMRLGKKLEKDFAIDPIPEKNIPGV
jgi:glutamate/tyrosine decarboxylase-like PLP-dependent enzyme